MNPVKNYFKMKKCLSFLLSIFFTFCLKNLFAQPEPPGGSPCFPPPCIPINDGIIFLAAAAAIFGAKKLLDFKKTSKAE